MSRRSWPIQILQDDLEEAAETFEVLLTSPEGAVIGGISKARVTIGGSGSRTGGRTPEIRPGQGQLITCGQLCSLSCIARLTANKCPPQEAAG